MGTRAFLSENKSRIEEEYRERASWLPRVFVEIDEKLKGCEAEVALACKYLYAFMPFSDIGNYPFEYFLDYAKNGVTLWREVPQVAELPEDIYLNYVLFHRVNEEEIAPCRTLFRERIGERTDGMSFKEAALEVNYWCGEEVTYQSSDDRTLSALWVYRRGNGRCGEESVFAVNALRSVGVPSRQVYAPKWSHCDDNHAWVEIWSQGQWYFLGACEPEPILNRGWFTGASSRSMMVHSRVFDRQIPAGEIIGRDGMVTMMNELSRYAKVKNLCVQVKDELGKPVQGALVSFEVLNYSEYAKIAEKVTDEKGVAELTTGLGSLHIWASIQREGTWLCAGAKVQVWEDGACEIRLKETAKMEEDWVPVDMIAPCDALFYPTQPDAMQKKRGRERLERANKKREEKIQNWRNPEIEVFLGRVENTFYREKMMEILTPKDRTDCRAEVLEEHLQCALLHQESLCDQLFVPYVLNPRVDDEVLQKYRVEIRDYFSETERRKFRKTPIEIWNYVDQNIKSCPRKERASVITTPSGCLKTETGSLLSKKILFVAIARTLGVPARLNSVDKAMEYWNGERFVSVLPGQGELGTLILQSGKDHFWSYLNNWSIAKLEDGSYQTLRYDGNTFEDHKMELKLETGIYRILTSNRLPNGNLFAYEHYLKIVPRETKVVELKLREANLGDLLENLSIPEFILKNKDGSEVTASELTADGMRIFLFLEEEKEPTEHILNEILERKEEFGEIAEKLLFVVREKKALQTATLKRVLDCLPQIAVYYDDFSEMIQVLGRRMYVDPDKLPLIFVTKGKRNGIYATSGYQVGCSDLLLRLMRG